MYKIIYSIGKKLAKENPSGLHGREVIKKWIKQYSEQRYRFDVLDIGCGRGYDILNIAKILTERHKAYSIHSIEFDDYYILECAKKGILPIKFDIEKTTFPYEDGQFDVVIINQLAEHIKEIFFLFGEIHRILRMGGLLIVGVPNLASLQDRITLLLGHQPTCAKVLGAHVRGFTYHGFTSFIENDNLFELVGFAGSGALKIFPKLATAIFFKLIKIKEGCFCDVLKKNVFDTPYRIEGEKSIKSGKPFTKKIYETKPEVKRRELWEK